ncbi:MAG: hypothetical protein ACAI35_22505 [Candidatus Methylacidiphilales bacterium]|nr:hypothetical protein [Candidatus Methylacidiphilales bacterium]
MTEAQRCYRPKATQDLYQLTPATGLIHGIWFSTISTIQEKFAPSCSGDEMAAPSSADHRIPASHKPKLPCTLSHLFWYISKPQNSIGQTPF